MTRIPAGILAGRYRLGGFVQGTEVHRPKPCRCRPGSPEMCGRCQQLADSEEELRSEPERHPEYEELVQAAERNHEAWLDRIGGG